MAANTVTGQQILFKVSADVNEMLSDYITTVNSQTSLRVNGISQDPHNTLKYALARIAGGGIKQITAWNHANQTMTLAGTFGVTAVDGMLLDVAGHDGKKRALIFDSINEAIRAAYPFWYQETVVNAAASAITLAAGTNSYALPTDVSALIAIGIQPASTDPIQWFKVGEPGMDFFAVEGQEGAYTIRFFPRFTRNGSFADEYTTQKLCTWYATKEPELDDESDTTQLPMDYFSVAAEAYLRRSLRGSEPDKLQQDVLAQQNLREVARNTLGRLGLGKEPPNPIVAKAYMQAAAAQGPAAEKGKKEKA